MAEKQRPRLVVLGTGFAGFSLVRNLDHDLYQTLIISPRNHFLFTPLLPSTTVGTIEFRSIVEPIRSAVPRAEYVHAHVIAVDTAGRNVRCRSVTDQREFDVAYDLLVIAVGATNNTFNIPGVKEHAFFLKELADARAIRQKIIDCFEQAAQPSIRPEERRRLLHFVVVGGGPTGVEFAAEMHDFLTQDLKKAYVELVPLVQITLVEAGKEILSSFDDALSEYTLKHFQRQKINVRLQSRVQRVEPTEIILTDGTKIPYGMVLWSTGIGPTDLVKSLPFEKDKSSRIIVDHYFRVKGVENVYVLGDCAAVEGQTLPATAQVAQQEGKYLAKALSRQVRGKPVKAFHYRNYGMLAYIGSNEALANLSSIRSKGFKVWIFWRSVYITKLVSLRNKILVLFDWMIRHLFGRDITRF